MHQKAKKKSGSKYLQKKKTAGNLIHKKRSRTAAKHKKAASQRVRLKDETDYETVEQRAIRILKEHGGMLRRKDVPQAGIHPRTLFALRDKGIVEVVTRGLYRLADQPPLSNPDLATVALRCPQGVVCLISALSYHQLTTQIPHEVQIALPRGAEPPRLRYPPLRVFWFRGQVYSNGIFANKIDGIDVRVYNREKTIADCFKYRHKIGLDVALEALRIYRQQASIDVESLLRYGRLCRVETVMRPYLEAIL
jgi:predicted transcriptional regulator of viral defense system